MRRSKGAGAEKDRRNEKGREEVPIHWGNEPKFSERGLEHQNDIKACKTSSHMVRHLLAEHEEEEERWDQVQFGMRIVRSTRTAFERQILESVIIQKKRKHHIMNNKSEYNHCALPRLTAMLGRKNLADGG